jgi:hypothetical protein
MNQYNTELQSVLDVHNQHSDAVARYATEVIDTTPDTTWSDAPYNEALGRLNPAYEATATNVAEVFDTFADVAPNMFDAKERALLEAAQRRAKSSGQALIGDNIYRVQKSLQPVFRAAFDANNLAVLNQQARREYRIWLPGITSASTEIAKVATAACFDKKLLDEGTQNMNKYTNDDKFMVTVNLLAYGSTPDARAAMANTLALSPGWSRRYLPLDNHLRR